MAVVEITMGVNKGVSNGDLLVQVPKDFKGSLADICQLYEKEKNK